MAKPQFILNSNDHISTLAVTGDLIVQHATELKARFSELLEHGGAIQLAFEQVTALDVASAQIIYAFKREMEKRGRQVVLSWPRQESVLDLQVKTGITKIL